MPLLHEPDKAEDTFNLTPDYDATLNEWAAQHPDRAHPRFTADECAAFTYRWPVDRSPQEVQRAALRAANGQFIKQS